MFTDSPVMMVGDDKTVRCLASGGYTQRRQARNRRRNGRSGFAVSAELHVTRRLEELTVARWIAETTFDCIDPKGKRRRVVARIGEPEMMPPEGKLSAYGRCRVSLEPLVKTRGVGGVDKFQALCLALNLIRIVLKGFVAQGGRVLSPDDGSAVDLDDASFGPYFDARLVQPRAKTRKRQKASKG